MTRVVLITGGTRGIGAAIAKAFAKAGYKVAANYAGNSQAAEAFKSETGIATFQWDVRDFNACMQGVKTVEAALGPVDILVNNAGIARDGMLHKMTTERWNDVLDINLSSCFNMSRQLIEGMRERGFGRIINISSVNGQKGSVGQTNYGAAKAGMIGFTKSLAYESARKGVTVNCIAPGYIKTEMLDAMPENVKNDIIATIPVGRFGESEEVAHCALFLADEKAGFITGATIAINGGQYVSG